MCISLKVKPLQPPYSNMCVDGTEKQSDNKAWRGAGFWVERRLFFPLHCDSTVLVSGLVTYCMLSVLFNRSEVSFKHGGSLGLFWRHHLPPKATPNTPGSFSSCSPGPSSSSGYGSSYSSSKPGQDDCMRPVSRLPVSDLPWWEAERGRGTAVTLRAWPRSSVGGKVKEEKDCRDVSKRWCWVVSGQHDVK